MTIRAEIQKLEPSALVVLFELDLTPLGGEVVRFHDGKNAVLAPVVWKAEEYSPFPIKAEGFEITGQDKSPRPRLTVANVDGLISVLVMEYDDLVGMKITRRRTFARFLDAVNFPGGVNPNADPAEETVDIWFIERKAAEIPGEAVEFELAGALDLDDVYLPRRQIIQNLCPWRYRGTGCGYAGGQVADRNDVPTSDAEVDECGKRLASCQLRWGAFAELPFGGFVAAGLTRV